MCDVASSDDPYPLFQDTVDNTDERIGLRANRRPRPDITRWHRIAQQLPDRARVDPKTTRRFALAQTLNHYRVVRPPIQFHSLHPPPFAPKCKGLSLTEFCSGATRLSGRFSEGLLLRRSQFMEVRHYCRPPGLPRCEQLWLATVLRKGCVCSIFNHAVVKWRSPSPAPFAQDQHRVGQYGQQRPVFDHPASSAIGQAALNVPSLRIHADTASRADRERSGHRSSGKLVE